MRRRPLSLAIVRPPSAGDKSDHAQNDELPEMFAPMASRPSSRCSTGAWSEHVRLEGLEMREEDWQMTTQAALKMWAPLATPDKTRWGMTAGRVKRGQAISMLARPHSTPPTLDPIPAEAYRRPKTSQEKVRKSEVHASTVLHTCEYRTLDRWQRQRQGEHSEPPSPFPSHRRAQLQSRKPKPLGRWGNPCLNASRSFERMGVMHDRVHAGKWSTVQREEQNPFRTCRMPDTMQDQMSQLRAEEEVDQVSGRLTSLSAMGEESSGSLGQVSGSLGQKSAEMGDRCVPQRGSRSSIGSRRFHRNARPTKDAFDRKASTVGGWGEEMEAASGFSRTATASTLALRAQDSIISRLENMERLRKTGPAVGGWHDAHMDSLALGVVASTVTLSKSPRGKSPRQFKGALRSPRQSRASEEFDIAGQGRAGNEQLGRGLSEKGLTSKNGEITREDSKMSVRTTDSLREASDLGYDGGGEGEEGLTINIFALEGPTGDEEDFGGEAASSPSGGVDTQSSQSHKGGVETEPSQAHSLGEQSVGDVGELDDANLDHVARQGAEEASEGIREGGEDRDTWRGSGALDAESSHSYRLADSPLSHISSPSGCIPSLGEGGPPSKLLDTLELEGPVLGESNQGYEDTAPDAVDGETVSTAHDGKSEKKEGAWEIPVRFLGENDSHPVHLVKSLDFQADPDVETLFVSAALGEIRERKYDRKFGSSPNRFARELKATLETTTQMVETIKNKYKRERATTKEESVTVFPVAGAKKMLLFAFANMRNPILSRAWVYWTFFLRQRKRRNELIGRLNQPTKPLDLPAHMRKSNPAVVSPEIRHLQFVCEDGEVKKIGFERDA